MSTNRQPASHPPAWAQGWPLTPPERRGRSPYRVILPRACSDLLRELRRLADPGIYPVLSSAVRRAYHRRASEVHPDVAGIPMDPATLRPDPARGSLAVARVVRARDEALAALEAETA